MDVSSLHALFHTVTGSSKLEPPFVVYNGTKLKDAKDPKATLAYKYRNWRGSKAGPTGMIAFQKKTLV